MRHVLAILLSLTLLLAPGVPLLAAAPAQVARSCACQHCSCGCCVSSDDAGTPASVPALPARTAFQSDWQLLPFDGLILDRAPSPEIVCLRPSISAVAISATPLYTWHCALLL